MNFGKKNLELRAPSPHFRFSIFFLNNVAEIFLNNEKGKNWTIFFHFNVLLLRKNKGAKRKLNSVFMYFASFPAPVKKRRRESCQENRKSAKQK